MLFICRKVVCQAIDSQNYCYFGFRKVRYAIRAENGAKLDKLMRRYSGFKTCDNSARHKIFFTDLKLLDDTVSSINY